MAWHSIYREITTEKHLETNTVRQYHKLAFDIVVFYIKSKKGLIHSVSF